MASESGLRAFAAGCVVALTTVLTLCVAPTARAIEGSDPTTSTPTAESGPRYNHAGHFALGGRAGWYRGGKTNESLLRGVGAMVRYQSGRHLGIEAGVSVFQPPDPGNCDCVLDIQVFPVEAGVMYFVFPDSPLSLYGLVGGTYEMTDVDVKADPADDVGYDSRLYQRWGGHAGVGAEVSFGHRFAVTADWRYLYYVSSPIPDPVGSAVAEYDTIHFTVGLNYFF